MSFGKKFINAKLNVGAEKMFKVSCNIMLGVKKEEAKKKKKKQLKVEFMKTKFIKVYWRAK